MLSTTHADRSTAGALDRIAATAARDFGVPGEIVRDARRATLRRFGPDEASAHERRLEAYFWGVVRKRAFRGGAKTAELRDRFLAAAETC